MLLKLLIDEIKEKINNKVWVQNAKNAKNLEDLLIEYYKYYKEYEFGDKDLNDEFRKNSYDVYDIIHKFHSDNLCDSEFIKMYEDIDCEKQKQELSRDYAEYKIFISNIEFIKETIYTVNDLKNLPAPMKEACNHVKIYLEKVQKCEEEYRQSLVELKEQLKNLKSTLNRLRF